MRGGDFKGIFRHFGKIRPCARFATMLCEGEAGFDRELFRIRFSPPPDRERRKPEQEQHPRRRLGDGTDDERRTI